MAVEEIMVVSKPPRTKNGQFKKKNESLLDEVAVALGGTDGVIGPDMIRDFLRMLDAVKRDKAAAVERLEVSKVINTNLNSALVDKQWGQVSEMREEIATLLANADVDGAEISRLYDLLEKSKTLNADRSKEMAELLRVGDADANTIRQMGEYVATLRSGLDHSERDLEFSRDAYSEALVELESCLVTIRQLEEELDGLRRSCPTSRGIWYSTVRK